MTESISDKYMRVAVMRLQARIAELNASPDPVDPTELDKLAKTLTTYLKSIADIKAFNQRTEEEAQRDAHIAYEDLPPPSFEERARFIARLQALYARIALAQGHTGIVHPDDVPRSDALDDLLGGAGAAGSNRSDLSKS